MNSAAPKGKPTDRNYTNDRRAGRTKPGKIELITDDDPRSKRYVGHADTPAPTSRRARRARGFRLPVDLNQCKRPTDRKR